MEDILLIKDIVTKRIGDIVKSFQTTNEDYQLSYEKYLEVCQSMYSVFCQKMKDVANKSIQTRVLLEALRLKLKRVIASHQYNDFATDDIRESSEYLLKVLKLEKKQNEIIKQDINVMIESILNKKEEINNNIFISIRRFMDRVIPVHFLGVEIRVSTYPQENKDEILSNLLNYLFQHMLALYQYCEEFDSLISTAIVGLVDYTRATRENTTHYSLTDAMIEDLCRITLLNGTTLLYYLLPTELKIRELSKIAPNFKNEPNFN